MNFTSSTQTTSWFRDRYLEQTLVLRPPYQRKPVWASRQRCYLIESVLLGLPIPEIYVHQVTSPEGKTIHAIVDGQQRIRTILQFLGAEMEPSEQEHNKFSLDKLDSDSRWYKKTFTDLGDEEKRQFYGYNFSVRYLNTDSENEVRDMFKRLNKFLAPLKPQELRNATFLGPFIQLATSLADNPYWAENRIVIPATIRRMGDVEFISELLIGVLHGPQDGSAASIDEYYTLYEDYEDEFPDQPRAETLYHETLKTMQRLFPEIRNIRWGNRADFYSLFVALAAQLGEHRLLAKNVGRLRTSLMKFAEAVDKRLKDEDAKVRKNVVEYVRAIEKGVNDKRRRGIRHLILAKLLSPYFTENQTN